MDWIRDGLKKPGLTQRGLAAVLGIDPSGVNRMLAGKRELKAREIALTARYLMVAPPTIVTESVATEASRSSRDMNMTPLQTSVPMIAYRLKVTRRALGLSQTELCARTGIAKNTYNQWKKEKGRPDLDGAFLLCDEFGVPLDWIYRGVRSCLPYDLAVKIQNCEAGALEKQKRPSKKADSHAF